MFFMAFMNRPFSMTTSVSRTDAKWLPGERLSGGHPRLDHAQRRSEPVDGNDSQLQPSGVEYLLFPEGST